MPRPVPIDPLKLIEAAEHLIEHQEGRGRPKPALLRRAVSSAYYALYHCLTVEAARTLLPEASTTEQWLLARGFGHQDLKTCCGWIAGRQGGVHARVKPIVDALKGSTLVDSCHSFWDLQEARHRADYDHLAHFPKPTTIGHVEDARRSINDVMGAAVGDRQRLFTLFAMRAAIR